MLQNLKKIVMCMHGAAMYTCAPMNLDSDMALPTVHKGTRQITARKHIQKQHPNTNMPSNAMARHWQLRQMGTQCKQHGYVRGTDADLAQLGLEAPEAALPCDVLKVQGIQLSPGQQVLALEQSYDGMVWQLSRLIHKRIFLAVHSHQGMTRNASSASVRPSSAKQQHQQRSVAETNANCYATHALLDARNEWTEHKNYRIARVSA